MSKQIVYCLHDKKNNICRIGMTSTGNDGRMLTQCAYYPYELDIFKSHVVNALHAEKHLHKLFKENRLRADWFNISPDDFEAAISEYKKIEKLRDGSDKFPVIICYDDNLKNWATAKDKLENILKNVIEKKHFFIANENGWAPKSIRSYADQRGISKSNFCIKKISEISSVIPMAKAIVVFWDGETNKFSTVIESARKVGLKERVMIIERKIKKNRHGNMAPTMKVVA